MLIWFDWLVKCRNKLQFATTSFFMEVSRTFDQHFAFSLFGVCLLNSTFIVSFNLSSEKMSCVGSFCLDDLKCFSRNVLKVEMKENELL